MNGFLILTVLYCGMALYELFVSMRAFFSKQPNIGLGVGSIAAGFMSGFLGIWVSTFEFAVLDVCIAFIVTMIVMLMLFCIKGAVKEQ